MALEDLVAATTAMNDLTAEVAGKMGQIDDKVDAATGSVPGIMNRTIYVDAIDGDDAALGTSGDPIKTVAQAATFMASGGYYVIKMASDLVVDTGVYMWGKTVVFEAAPGVTLPSLAWANQIDGVSSQSPRLRIMNGSGVIRFNGVKVQTVQLSGHVTNKAMISVGGLQLVDFYGCELVVPAGADLPLLQNAQYIGLVVRATTVPAAMAGLWLDSVAAATDPDTVANILKTNLTSL